MQLLLLLCAVVKKPIRSRSVQCEGVFGGGKQPAKGPGVLCKERRREGKIKTKSFSLRFERGKRQLSSDRKNSSFSQRPVLPLLPLSLLACVSRSLSAACSEKREWSPRETKAAKQQQQLRREQRRRLLTLQRRMRTPAKTTPPLARSPWAQQTPPAARVRYSVCPPSFVGLEVPSRAPKKEKGHQRPKDSSLSPSILSLSLLSPIFAPPPQTRRCPNALLEATTRKT